MIPCTRQKGMQNVVQQCAVEVIKANQTDLKQQLVTGVITETVTYHGKLFRIHYNKLS